MWERNSLRVAVCRNQEQWRGEDFEFSVGPRRSSSISLIKYVNKTGVNETPPMRHLSTPHFSKENTFIALFACNTDDENMG